MRHNPFQFLSAKKSLLLGLVLAIAISITAQPITSSAAGIDYKATKYADRVVDRGYVVLYNRHIDTQSRAYWYPRVMEKGSATWFAAAIMDGAEYKRGAGRLSDTDFINLVYSHAESRKATTSEMALWKSAFRNGTQTRTTMVGWAIENLFGYRLAPPDQVVNCSQYNRGGSIVPLCVKGLAGNQKSVSILKIPNTSIYVNRVWYQDVDSFVRYAKTKGYNLDVSQGSGPTAWMLSPGSWRSWDEQNWLYTHINPETGRPYPANPPGKSMHEWGLALDLQCNGKSIETVRSCWDWVRANGGAYNIRNFYTVNSPDDSEAWHFSPNNL